MVPFLASASSARSDSSPQTDIKEVFDRRQTLFDMCNILNYLTNEREGEMTCRLVPALIFQGLYHWLIIFYSVGAILQSNGIEAYRLLINVSSSPPTSIN